MNRMKLTILSLVALGLCFATNTKADEQKSEDKSVNTQEESMHDFFFSQPEFNFMIAQLDENKKIRQGGDRRRAGLGKKRRHLEQLRMLKMLELLDLSDDQETPFLKAFRRVRRDIGDLNKEKEAKLKELGSLLRSDDPDDRQLLAISDAILKIAQERQAKNEEFLRRARRILSANQYARFIVFQERFEYELLERMKAFRSGQGPGRPGTTDGP